MQLIGDAAVWLARRFALVRDLVEGELLEACLNHVERIRRFIDPWHGNQVEVGADRAVHGQGVAMRAENFGELGIEPCGIEGSVVRRLLRGSLGGTSVFS